MKRKRVIILAVIAVVIIGVCIAVIGVKSGIEANLNKLVDLTIPNVDTSAAADGTYSGSYKVFPVAAEVEVDVKDHKITGIRLIKHTNGQGKAAEIITGKVVEAQSLGVDIVSGATYSSKVILKAIENALNSAVK